MTHALASAVASRAGVQMQAAVKDSLLPNVREVGDERLSLLTAVLQSFE